MLTLTQYKVWMEDWQKLAEDDQTRIAVLHEIRKVKQDVERLGSESKLVQRRTEDVPGAAVRKGSFPLRFVDPY